MCNPIPNAQTPAVNRANTTLETEIAETAPYARSQPVDLLEQELASAGDL